MRNTSNVLNAWSKLHELIDDLTDSLEGEGCKPNYEYIWRRLNNIFVDIYSEIEDLDGANIIIEMKAKEAEKHFVEITLAKKFLGWSVKYTWAGLVFEKGRQRVRFTKPKNKIEVEVDYLKEVKLFSTMEYVAENIMN